MTPDDVVESVSPLVVALPKSLFPTAAGCVAFGSTLAVSTLVQMKMLGVSTGSIRPIPSVLGVVTVALASLASHKASIRTYHVLQNYVTDFGQDDDATTTISRRPSQRISNAQATAARGGTVVAVPETESHPLAPQEFRFRNIAVSYHTLRICAVGLVAFKLLGGRFWAIAPSSYTHLGSFARFSIPATERYATPAERAVLARIGHRWGCHTCGAKMWFRQGIAFHGDHMPPKIVADQMNKRLWRRILGIKTQYRFFPQCVDCSNTQGQVLGKASRRLKDFGRWVQPNLAFAGGGRAAYYHGFRMRLNHLAGGIVAALTISGATKEDIDDEGAARLQKLQKTGEDILSPLVAHVRRPFVQSNNKPDL